MKTASRENPNHRATLPLNRAHGAVGENRSRSTKWAAKQEKREPKEMCFFLTSTFIELLGSKSGTSVSNSSCKSGSASAGLPMFMKRRARDSLLSGFTLSE